MRWEQTEKNSSHQGAIGAKHIARWPQNGEKPLKHRQ
jgi:hypothetical protein